MKPYIITISIIPPWVGIILQDKNNYIRNKMLFLKSSQNNATKCCSRLHLHWTEKRLQVSCQPVQWPQRYSPKTEVWGCHRKWVDARLSQGHKRAWNVHNGSFHTKKCVDAILLRPRPTTPLTGLHLWNSEQLALWHTSPSLILFYKQQKIWSFPN